MTRIVDARSGRDVRVGDTIRYPGEEWWQLHDVRVGLLSGEALIEYHEGDETWTRWMPLVVRYLHPAFPLQRVAFVPT